MKNILKHKIWSYAGLLAGIILFFVSISYAYDLYDLTHNGRYSGEYAVSDCKKLYKDPEDISNKCQNYSEGYFYIRIVVFGGASLILLRLTIDRLAGEDKDK